MSVPTVTNVEGPTFIDLYNQLASFPDNVKSKICISGLANIYTDLMKHDIFLNGLGYDELIDDFLRHIKCIDLMAKNSSALVAGEIADWFSSGFLEIFVKPTLLQVGGFDNTQELLCATHYFKQICENISQPVLIEKIMKFIIPHSSELLPRMRQIENADLATETLNLFKTLLLFYCEDLWYDLLLQHLMPMKHVLVSDQQKAIPNINASVSASKFFELIPDALYDLVGFQSWGENFVLYIQQELWRVREMNLLAFPVANMDEANHNHTNPIFPSWTFKYDGTDVLLASRKESQFDPELEEYFEDDLFTMISEQPPLDSIQSQTEDSLCVPSTSTSTNYYLEQSATPVVVSEFHSDLPDAQNQTEHSVLQVNSLTTQNVLDWNEELGPDNTTQGSSGLSIPAESVIHDNDDTPETTKYSSDTIISENGAATLVITRKNSESRNTFLGEKRRQSNQQSYDDGHGYLGPFLEILYSLLCNWTKLNSEFLFVLTEVFAILASSRIPLITSLLLDTSTVLQPSYPSFLLKVHGVKAKLESFLKRYPSDFILKQWESISKDIMLENGHGERENTNGFFAAIKSSLGKDPFSSLEEFSRNRGYAISRFLSRQRGNASSLKNSIFEDANDEQYAKGMTVRSIIFAHWMLEMSSIAQQSTWSNFPKVNVLDDDSEDL